MNIGANKKVVKLLKLKTFPSTLICNSLINRKKIKKQNENILNIYFQRSLQYLQNSNFFSKSSLTILSTYLK